MAGDSLFVSPDGLDAGSNRCDDASLSASSGAALLRSVVLEDGIFGDFDAAHDLHGVANDVHDHQVEKFSTHAESLTTLSDKGRRAAQTFTATDELSATVLGGQVPSDGT